MAIPGPLDSDGHARLALGLYLAARLSEADNAIVEAHLASCHLCLAEADELGDAVTALILAGQLPDALPVHPGPARTAESARAAARNPAPAPRTGVPGGADRRGGTGPRGRRGGAAPGRTAGGAARRRRSGYGLAGLAGLVVVLVVSVGVVLAIIRQPSGPAPTPVPVTLAGSASDPKSGVGLSVTAVANGDGVVIQATITGLQPTASYRFSVITVDGRMTPVTAWIAADSTHSLKLDLAVPLNRLSVFVVSDRDGSPVVSAYALSPGSPTVPASAASPSRG